MNSQRLAGITILIIILFLGCAGDYANLRNLFHIVWNAYTLTIKTLIGNSLPNFIPFISKSNINKPQGFHNKVMIL